MIEEKNRSVAQSIESVLPIEKNGGVKTQFEELNAFVEILKSQNQEMGNLFSLALEQPEEVRRILIELDAHENVSFLQKTKGYFDKRRVLNELLTSLSSGNSASKDALEKMLSASSKSISLPENLFPVRILEGNVSDALRWLAEISIVSKHTKLPIELGRELAKKIFLNLPQPENDTDVRVKISSRSRPSSHLVEKDRKNIPTITYSYSSEQVGNFIADGEISSEGLIKIIGQYLHEFAHNILNTVLVDDQDYQYARENHKHYSLFRSLEEAFPIWVEIQGLMLLKQEVQTKGNIEAVELINKRIKEYLLAVDSTDIYRIGLQIAKQSKIRPSDELIAWVKSLDFKKLSQIDIASQEGEALMKDPIHLFPRR